jgi:hypothetical protein
MNRSLYAYLSLSITTSNATPKPQEFLDKFRTARAMLSCDNSLDFQEALGASRTFLDHLAQCDTINERLHRLAYETIILVLGDALDQDRCVAKTTISRVCNLAEFNQYRPVLTCHSEAELCQYIRQLPSHATLSGNAAQERYQSFLERAKNATRDTKKILEVLCAWDTLFSTPYDDIPKNPDPLQVDSDINSAWHKLLEMAYPNIEDISLITAHRNERVNFDLEIYSAWHKLLAIEFHQVPENCSLITANRRINNFLTKVVCACYALGLYGPKEGCMEEYKRQLTERSANHNQQVIKLQKRFFVVVRNSKCYFISELWRDFRKAVLEIASDLIHSNQCVKKIGSNIPLEYNTKPSPNSDIPEIINIMMKDFRDTLNTPTQNAFDQLQTLERNLKEKYRVGQNHAIMNGAKVDELVALQYDDMTVDELVALQYDDMTGYIPGSVRIAPLRMITSPSVGGYTSKCDSLHLGMYSSQGAEFSTTPIQTPRAAKAENPAQPTHPAPQDRARRLTNKPLRKKLATTTPCVRIDL